LHFVRSAGAIVRRNDGTNLITNGSFARQECWEDRALESGLGALLIRSAGRWFSS
jgi:hypothetical protein